MELRHMLLWVYSLSSTPWAKGGWALGRTNFSNFPNNFSNFCIKKKRDYENERKQQDSGFCQGHSL